MKTFESCIERGKDEASEVSIADSSSSKRVAESWDSLVAASVPDASLLAKALSYVLQTRYPGGDSYSPDCWEYACSNPSVHDEFSHCAMESSHEDESDLGFTTGPHSSNKSLEIEPETVPGTPEISREATAESSTEAPCQ